MGEPLAPDLDFVDITADLLDARAFNGRRTYVLGEELVNFDVDVVTDSSGDIIFWFVNATKNRAPRPGEQGVGFTANRRELGAADLGRLDLRDESGVVLGIDRAVIESNPGTWTLIPEPATASLMGLGLLGLAASAGRGRR